MCTSRPHKHGHHLPNPNTTMPQFTSGILTATTLNSENDMVGEQLTDWASTADLNLLFDPKQPKTFHSGRWQIGTNLDLCFSRGLPMMALRRVLVPFPKSQHFLTVVHIGIEIPLVHSQPKPSWNFRKADWTAFTKAAESKIEDIPPVSVKCAEFVHLLSAATDTILHGFRKPSTSIWTAESERILKEHNKNWEPRRCAGSN